MKKVHELIVSVNSLCQNYKDRSSLRLLMIVSKSSHRLDSFLIFERQIMYTTIRSALRTQYSPLLKYWPNVFASNSAKYNAEHR